MSADSPSDDSKPTDFLLVAIATTGMMLERKTLVYRGRQYTQYESSLNDKFTYTLRNRLQAGKGSVYI